MESDYWQVAVEEEVEERMKLFNPNGNRQWNLIPMEELNFSTTFVAILMKLQKNGSGFTQNDAQTVNFLKIST